MPPVTKVSKDEIIDKTYQILSRDGIESINARRIAKELNCSVQPIFSNFNSMEDLINEVTNLVKQKCFDYLLSGSKDSCKPYKQVGINYIKFAKEETNFFKFLFMSGSDLVPKEFISRDNEDYQELTKLIKLSTQLKDEDIADFHTKMWVFTHGIAMLVATDTVKLTESQIKELLSLEFQALMLLEENKDNKWVSKD